jgi:hypothetical protein
MLSGEGRDVLDISGVLGGPAHPHLLARRPGRLGDLRLEVDAGFQMPRRVYLADAPGSRRMTYRTTGNRANFHRHLSPAGTP